MTMASDKEGTRAMAMAFGFVVAGYPVLDAIMSSSGSVKNDTIFFEYLCGWYDVLM